MSVNIKDSSRPNDLNPVTGRVPDNVYKYEDALSLEEISASTDLTNKIPTAEAVGKINTNLGGFTPVIDSTGKITGYKTKVGADTVFPFNSISCNFSQTEFFNETIFNGKTIAFTPKNGAKYVIVTIYGVGITGGASYSYTSGRYITSINCDHECILSQNTKLSAINSIPLFQFVINTNGNVDPITFTINTNGSCCGVAIAIEIS